MANIDLGNLTRYDSKIKEYAEDKYLSKNTANWQMTEKAGAVTCYPVPDTELEPIVDFSFKEVPPASGEKSPSNPSTIQGINNITLTRCNKNLIDTSSLGVSKTGRGVTWTNNNGIITVNRTETDSRTAFYDLKGSYDNPSLFSAGTYTFTRGIGSSNIRIGFASGDTTLWNEDGSVLEKTFTLNSPVFGRLYYALYQDSTADNVVTMPQLELGTESTKFEKGEGNIYTYSLGNTYYGGSVNLATGMMTVTQQGFIFDGSENWGESSGEFIFNLSPANTAIWNAYSSQACTHYPLDATGITEDSFRLSRYYIYIKTSGTLVEFKNFLATQYANSMPVVATYALLFPYTIQLTPMQIKSLFALDKNTPRLNTLYTDADSIQVGYQKHPARTSYELENAILALGGGE